MKRKTYGRLKLKAERKLSDEHTLAREREAYRAHNEDKL